MSGILRAAFGKVVITPEEIAPLQGYDPEKFIANPDTDILHPLFARIMLLENEQCRSVVISVDCCKIGEELERVPSLKDGSWRYREFDPAFPQGTMQSWAQAAEIAEHQITVHATHTHSGPVHFSEKYTSRIEREIIELRDRLVPVKLEIGKGECNISANRRPNLSPNFDIAINKTFHVLLFKAMDGTPLGSVVNCAVHPTMLKNPRNRVSGDFVGLAMSQLEEHYGESFVSLFIQGFSADICPHFKGRPTKRETADTLPLVQQAGHQLFLDISDALRSTREVPVYPLAAAQTTVALPSRKEFYETDIPMTLKALQIGEVVVLSVSGEIFNGYIDKIGRQSPFPYTLFSGLANGYKGYLPTREAYLDELGGYEINTTPFVHQADDVFVEAAVHFLRRLSAE
jgi:hypothetical protein